MKQRTNKDEKTSQIIKPDDNIANKRKNIANEKKTSQMKTSQITDCCQAPSECDVFYNLFTLLFFFR